MDDVFRVMRSMSGINEAEYLLSTTGDFNAIEFVANTKAKGQFHFFTSDGRFLEVPVPPLVCKGAPCGRSRSA